MAALSRTQENARRHGAGGVLGARDEREILSCQRLPTPAAPSPVEVSHDFFRADRTLISLRRYGARWKRAVEPPAR